VEKELKFLFELAATILNRWIHTVKYPTISGEPNTPSHSNDDLHCKGNYQLVLDLSEDLFHRSSGNKSYPNGVPTCFRKVATQEEMSSDFWSL
jgi:hypothetical protein